MRDKEIVGLYQAYLDVYSNSNEEVEQLDEDVQGAVKGALEKGANFMKTNPVGKAVSKIIAPVGGGRKTPTATSGGYRKEEIDLFDAILEHLVAEGYADTNESALAIMANMSEEWRQDIMEISQKTATSAYAKSATGEFEGADSDHDIKRTENLGKHIERKFGKKALEDADRHADSSTFGRKDPRTGKRQPRPQSRFQKPNKYRTRADGKMHGQDQNKLKAELQRRRGED